MVSRQVSLLLVDFYDVKKRTYQKLSQQIEIDLDMEKDFETTLSPEVRLKIELWREFGDEAPAVYDFVKPSLVGKNKDAEDGEIEIIGQPSRKTDPDGVYILYKNGEYELFNGSNKEDDVAYIGVKMGEKKIAVALHDLGDEMSYQFLPEGIEADQESDAYTSECEINAYEDFDGAKNTERIKRAGSTLPLDQLNDGEYIGAIGEYGIIMMNLSKVNEALKYVGGTPLKGWYWSSTESSRDRAWNFVISEGLTYNTTKHVINTVRAVAAFETAAKAVNNYSLKDKRYE